MAIAIMGKLVSLWECNEVRNNEFSGLVIGERELWITRSIERKFQILKIVEQQFNAKKKTNKQIVRFLARKPSCEIGIRLEKGHGN